MNVDPDTHPDTIEGELYRHIYGEGFLNSIHAEKLQQDQDDTSNVFSLPEYDDSPFDAPKTLLNRTGITTIVRRR
jgi:hypothetical protein